jgi:hypothetical protein
MISQDRAEGHEEAFHLGLFIYLWARNGISQVPPILARLLEIEMKETADEKYSSCQLANWSAALCGGVRPERQPVVDAEHSAGAAARAVRSATATAAATRAPVRAAAGPNSGRFCQQ